MAHTRYLVSLIYCLLIAHPAFATESDFSKDDISSDQYVNELKIDEKNKKKSWKRHAVWAVPAVMVITMLALGSAYGSSRSSLSVPDSISSALSLNFANGGSLRGRLELPKSGVQPQISSKYYYQCLISRNPEVEIPLSQDQKNPLTYTALWQLRDITMHDIKNSPQGPLQQRFFGSSHYPSLPQGVTAIDNYSITLHELKPQEYHECWAYIHNLNRGITELNFTQTRE